jgi:hypothetical protein
MTTYYEKNWVTAEGEQIPFCKVTHQHWSNIYWYHKVFAVLCGMNKMVMEQIVFNAKLQIEQKFGGEILPWKPTFEFELNWLHYLNLIRVKNERLFIVDKWGHEIGEIVGNLKFVPGMKLFALS